MTAKEILDNNFLEMRWRCLSLAADLDRIERTENGAQLLQSDTRVLNLRKALQILSEGKQNRAEQVQMLFSDMSPPPAIANRKSQIANPQ
jgi:hypothetical protein